MGNLTAGSRPQPYGEGGRYVYLPVEASTQLWESGMVSPMLTDGGLVPATTAGSGHVCGIAVFDELSANPSVSRMKIWTDKVFIFNAGVHAPTDATPFGTVLYAESDNTVGTGAGGETTIAGRFYGIEDDGRVRVYVSSQGSWNDANDAGALGPLTTYKARAVVTTLQAYTGTTTGVLTQTTPAAGLSTADGVTLAVGDVVFIQEGTTNLTTASDAGPYVVTALGSASVSWVLTRPSWYETGNTMFPAQVLDIGGEGTAWGGTQWKSFAAKGSIIDTAAPSFFVGCVTQSVTLAAGFVTKTNVGIHSLTTTSIGFQSTNFSGGALTVSYRPGAYASGGAATAIGAAGTASVSMTALVAAGTISASDVSSGLLTICNW